MFIAQRAAPHSARLTPPHDVIGTMSIVELEDVFLLKLDLELSQ